MPASANDSNTPDTAESAARSVAAIVTVSIDRVVKRAGHHHFVLSVFLRQSQPTTKLQLISATEQFFRTRPRPLQQRPNASTGGRSPVVEHESEPDYQVERRYVEFVELRRALVAIATSTDAAADHRLSDRPSPSRTFRCDLLAFLTHDKKQQPRHTLQYATTSSRRLSDMLAAFTVGVVALVATAASPLTSSNVSECECEPGVLEAAALLAAFLHKPRDSSLGII